MRTRRSNQLVAMLVVGCVVAACSESNNGDDLAVAPPISLVSPSTAPTASASASTGDGGEPTTTATPSSASFPEADGTIQVDTAGTRVPVSPNLFGTNLPAWAGPERLTDATFEQRITELGTTVLRMPGGSWSSSYDWLACENGDAAGCFWTWAARPSDYADFVQRTGVAGMWTVSFNGTAEEAAALVGFFNGEVDDSRVIGVDKNGRDWGTVGTWASLRASHGHPDPVRIDMWEVGNEVYGAKPTAGPDCSPYGWEAVWTCDGAQYVTGDDVHDGYLRFRDVMKMVDPTISVGAVGIGGFQDSWSDFGNEVIGKSGTALDFYIVHNYGFDTGPSPLEVLGSQAPAWEAELSPVREALDERNPGRTVPIAITEYNLIAFQEGDTTGMMGEAINGLYIAEAIGEMARLGVSVANQWNLVNGPTDTGSDYGMLDPDTSEPKPQYYALALWSRMAPDLLTVDAAFDNGQQVATYASMAEDGTLTILAVNKASEAVDAAIIPTGAAGTYSVTSDAATAAAVDATAMSYNGASSPIGALADHPAADLGEIDASEGFVATLAPTSITLLTMKPVSAS